MAAYWEIAAHSAAYDMFSKNKYLIANLVLSRLRFWSGDFFLIAPVNDHCLLVPIIHNINNICTIFAYIRWLSKNFMAWKWIRSFKTPFIFQNYLSIRKYPATPCKNNSRTHFISIMLSSSSFHNEILFIQMFG